MGSGLILLVIVGAWLAVLVPMALRSHDAATSLRSAERFGDAMRVLSPRGRREAQQASSGEADWLDEDAPEAASPAGMPALEPLLHDHREPAPRAPLSIVERRRRVLMVLSGTAVALLLGVLLTPWLLVPAVVTLGLTVAYVVHLRRLAVARAQRARSDDRVQDDAYDTYDDDAYDAYDGEGAYVATHPVEPAPAVRYEDPLPQAVGGWDDSGWSPVPVPPPVYVGKPVAPPRAPRVLDLTEPGRWSDGVTAGELGAAPDLELDDILEGRRVPGGW